MVWDQTPNPNPNPNPSPNPNPDPDPNPNPTPTPNPNLNQVWDQNPLLYQLVVFGSLIDLLSLPFFWWR